MFSSLQLDFSTTTGTWTWIGLQVSQINNLTCWKNHKCEISEFNQIGQRGSQSLEVRAMTIIKRNNNHQTTITVNAKTNTADRTKVL